MHETIFWSHLNNEAYILIAIIAFVVIIALSVWLAVFLKGFSRELEYINMEIERSEGSERRYWKKQRRRLWLSLIPFIKY